MPPWKERGQHGPYDVWLPEVGVPPFERVRVGRDYPYPAEAVHELASFVPVVTEERVPQAPWFAVQYCSPPSTTSG